MAWNRKPRGQLRLVLGGKTVTVLDGDVHTGVTLGSAASSMLVSHDLFTVMEQEVRDGKASQKAKT